MAVGALLIDIMKLKVGFDCLSDCVSGILIEVLVG